jgi:PTH1 family peptidyl-tRNA hydrolase
MLQIIAGLGNPGGQYDKTRHNAGFWFIDALADRLGVRLQVQSKYHCTMAQAVLDGHKLWLVKPMTFMNVSGKSIAPLANFYKIPPENILIAHDEMSIPVGSVKLKQGGSHSGHNGLKSIDGLYGKNYHRLRIGIDHPGDKNLVTPYVLGNPSPRDKQDIMAAIDEAVYAFPSMYQQDWDAAKRILHNFRPVK